MNVVVTGAAGKLGRHVVRELRAAGHQVVGLDRRYLGLLPGRRRVDLRDPAQADRRLAGAEAVVHLGNHPYFRPGEGERVFEENMRMNRNTFDAACRHGARQIIFASSIQAVRSEQRLLDAGGCRLPWLPLDGDLPAAPTNPYARSKSMSEDLLRECAARHPLSAVALRFPYLVQEPPPANATLENPFLDEAFTWLSFADGARLIRALLAAPRPGFRIYLPAAARPRVAGDAEGLRLKYYPSIPLKSPPPLASLVDCSAIFRDTGWTPRDL
jgi:UDP-glucose 4-epimerase